MSKLSPPYSWIERDLQPRFPLLAEKAIDAYEIWVRATSSGQLDARDVSRLKAFCLDKSSMLRDWAAMVVGALSTGFPEAAELLIELAQSGRVDVGLSAIAALHNGNNPRLFERVASCGLRHKSRKVRELSACKIQTHGMRALLGELSEAMASEADPNCQKALEFSFYLLRDGHLVEELDSGDAYITVAGPRSVIGQTCSSEIIKAKGLPLLIEELKSSANV